MPAESFLLTTLGCFLERRHVVSPHEAEIAPRFELAQDIREVPNRVATGGSARQRLQAEAEKLMSPKKGESSKYEVPPLDPT